jgi:hypothetical protein
MRSWTKALVAIFFFICSPLLAANLNWAKNGDFQSKDAWTGNPLTVDKGRDGGKAALLENSQSQWSAYKQSITLPQPAPPVIGISFGMKTDSVVPGTKDWELARANVTFFDEKGNQVGGWPDDPGRATGTTAWKNYTHTYPVPAGAATVVVSLELGNATGKVWFDQVNVTVYDFDAKPLAAGSAAAHPKLKTASKAPTDNWLLNPGFEDLLSSDWSTTKTGSPGHDSPSCLTIQSDKPEWVTSSQMVLFAGQKPATLVLSGWIKTQDVKKGDEPYMAARFSLDFRDEKNQQVGGWQDGVGTIDGTTPWTRYEKAYPVPPGAAQAEVGAGLAHCTGQAWFDDMAVYLLDASGKRLTAHTVSEQKSDTKDWQAFVPGDSPDATSLDLSSLNEMPAGKHGFVTNKNGRYVFEDGTPGRFWGTDLVGGNAFLTHEQADAVATRLAKLGVNLVRLHHMDAPWADPDIFDPSAKDTQTFSADSLDRLDYLLAALKKNGIYVYPDLLVHRKYREDDKVPDYEKLTEGAKGVAHFSRRIIELNKLYAKMLLTHVNPYTKKSLAEDPFFFGTELVNESSIFSGFGLEDFPPAFEAELQAKYEAWGGKGKITRFAWDWDKQALKAARNPENAESSMKFLSATTEATNDEMLKYLRSLGVKSLFTMSNQGLGILADIRADAKMSHIDTHSYWDHPQIWKIDGGWSKIEYAPFDNTSQLTNPFKGSLVESLSAGTVLGKATVITEWNDCVPNEYRLEGPVLMACYGSLQDWGGMLQFDYSPGLPGATKLSNFSINTRPANEVMYQAGAVLFRKGLLKTSDVTVVEPLSDAKVLSPESASTWIADHPWLPYAAMVRKDFTGKVEKPLPSLDQVTPLYDVAAKTIQSSTGELALDYGKGLLKVDAPQVQGFVGTVGSGATLKATDVEINFDARNPWAGVLAVSLDGKALKQSSRFVIFATAKEENSGQVFNSTRTALKDPGQAPVLEQWVKGTLTLKAEGTGTYIVRALDASGKPGKPLSCTFKAGLLTVSLSPVNASGYYEVTRQ